MQLHALCYYRSKSEDWTDPWTDRHYLARNLVKGVKRSVFGGFSLLPLLNGKFKRLDNTPAGQKVAMNYVSQYLLKRLKDAGYASAHIVPIPASGHVDPKVEFTGGRIASAIQERDPAFQATPVLYFDKPQPKSAAVGGRNSLEIESHLRSTNLADLENVVLLDDVMTSGAHLRAAARYLAKKGIDVEDAFVVGRTIWHPKPSMFKCDAEELCA